LKVLELLEEYTMEKWQTEVKLAELDKYLTQTYDHKLKNGEIRKRDKYRLSYLPKGTGTAVINDVTDEGFKTHMKKRWAEKSAKKSEKLQKYRAKIKEGRKITSELKKGLRKAEKGQRAIIRQEARLENKIAEDTKKLEMLRKKKVI